MKKIYFIFAAILFLLIPTPSHAIQFLNGDKTVFSPDKTYNETVFVAGDSLSINSPINGDLFCAGRNIIINAPIAGDVICAAETIKISGRFTGNLRVAARTIDTDAEVHSSATLLGQKITVMDPSVIGGDLIAAGSDLSLKGKIARDLAVAGENIDYSGQLLRNAVIAGPSINLNSTAKIGGTLDLYLPSDARVNLPDKIVTGTVNRHEIKTDQKPTTPVQPTAAGWLSAKIWSILSFLFVGIALLKLIPQRTLTSVNLAISRPVASFLTGFGTLILAPIAFIILLITLIGLPLSFILLFMYIIGLIISSVFTSLIVGNLILSNLKVNSKFQTPFYFLFLGLPLLWLSFSIPQIGWFIRFISLCLGLGCFALSFFPGKPAPVEEK